MNVGGETSLASRERLLVDDGAYAREKEIDEIMWSHRFEDNDLVKSRSCNPKGTGLRTVEEWE